MKYQNKILRDGQRGRKILKLNEGGGDTSSDDDVTMTSNEKKDLQFRLRHDLDEMYSVCFKFLLINRLKQGFTNFLFSNFSFKEINITVASPPKKIIFTFFCSSSATQEYLV